VPYVLRYHPAVAEEDIPSLPRNLRARIARAIETRLTAAPQRYGVPLRGTLKGYWKLRVGDYRIVFKVVADEVWILTILHRGTVYEEVTTRTPRRPGSA
jgi:mRNA interferase RelE/StbE